MSSPGQESESAAFKLNTDVCGGFVVPPLMSECCPGLQRMGVLNVGQRIEEQADFEKIYKNGEVAVRSSGGLCSVTIETRHVHRWSPGGAQAPPTLSRCFSVSSSLTAQ